jgi:hypothetical protein
MNNKNMKAGDAFVGMNSSGSQLEANQQQHKRTATEISPTFEGKTFWLESACKIQHRSVVSLISQVFWDYSAKGSLIGEGR